MRDYLTSTEIMNIVDELVKVDEEGKLVHEKASEREILKVAMVAQCLCEEEVKDMKTCNDMYDWYVMQSIDFDFDVKNYGDIDRLVKEELGVNSVVRKLLGDISKKMIRFDMNNTIEQLKGVINKDANI